MSRILNTLLVLALMSAPVLSPVAQAAPAASNTQATVTTLADKLAKLGSFQAEYDAISSENKVNLLMLVNQKRHYALTQVSLAGDPLRWLVIDYSPTTVAKGMMILMITEEGVQRLPMPFDAIMQDLDNPVGALRFLSEQLAGVKPEPITGPGALSLQMGLTATDMKVSMAMNSRPGPTTGSWLQDADKASRSEWADGVLKLFYPEQHEVHVDGASGLLKLERWPNPNQPGPREVRLVRHGALAKDVPYQELIPDFEQLAEQAASIELITPQFYGAMLAELEPKQLTPLTPEREQQLVQAARARYRQQLSQDSKKIRTYLEQEFKPWYQAVIERNSAQGLSFEAFLLEVTKAIENEPGSVMLPQGDVRLEKLENELRQALGVMSEDKAEKLGEIYGQGRRALVDAWSLEMLAAITKLPEAD